MTKSNNLSELELDLSINETYQNSEARTQIFAKMNALYLVSKVAFERFPTEYIDSMIASNFNPGSDGILSLITLSDDSKKDKAIKKLIGAFATIDLNARVVKAILNSIETLENAVVDETSEAIFEKSLNNQNTLAAILDSSNISYKKKIELIQGVSDHTLRFSLMSSSEKVFWQYCENLVAAKNYKEGYKLLQYIFSQPELEGMSAFRILSNDSMKSLFIQCLKESDDHISDEVAMTIVQSYISSKSHRSYEATPVIKYRSVYEDISVRNGYYENSGILVKFHKTPLSSIHAVIKIVERLNQKSGTSYPIDEFIEGMGKNFSISVRYPKYKNAPIYLDYLFKCYSPVELTKAFNEMDEESRESLRKMDSSLIKTRLKYLKDDEAAVKAFYKCAGKSIQNELATKYPDYFAEVEIPNKVNLKPKQSDVFDWIIKAISDDNASEFERTLSLLDGENKMESLQNKINLKSHQRIKERLYFSEDLLIELSNKAIFKAVLASEIRVSHNHDSFTKNSGEKIGLTNKEIIKFFSKGQISMGCALSLSPNYKELILDEDFDLKNHSLDEYFKGKELENIVLEVLKTKSKAKFNIYSDDILMKFSNKISKDAALNQLEIDVVSCFGLKMQFKDGETLNLQDIQKTYKDKSGYEISRVVASLCAVDKYKEEAVRICQSIIKAEADDFTKIFPKAGNRDKRLRDMAVKTLQDIDSSFEGIAQKPGKVNTVVDNALNSSRKITDLVRSLGEDWVLKLNSRDGRKLKLLINDIRLATREDFEALESKYTFELTEFRYSEEDVKKVKLDKDSLDCLLEKNSTPVKARISGFNAIKYMAIPLIESKSNVIVEFGSEIVEVIVKSKKWKLLTRENYSYYSGTIAKSIDREDFLKIIDLKIDVDVDDYAVFVYAQESMEFIDQIASKKFKFKQGKIHFDLDKINREFAVKLGEIGIIPSSHSDEEFVQALRQIFDKNGEIKEFNEVDASGLSSREVARLLRIMGEIDPAYLDQLKENLDDYVIQHKSKAKAMSFEAKNLVQYFGFGSPTFTKDESRLFDSVLLTHKNRIIQNFRNLKAGLEVFNLSTIAFQDIFGSAESNFEPINYNHGVDDLPRLKLLIKDVSKEEVKSILNADTYAKTDTLRGIKEINKKIADIASRDGVELFDPNTVFYMSLDGETLQSETPSLIEVSKIIKALIISISQDRKLLRAGGSEKIMNGIHDRLGTAIKRVEEIANEKDIAIMLARKLPFHKLNDVLMDENFYIRHDGNKEFYYAYFAEDHREIRELGDENKWCTSWSDDYFDNCLAGKSLLFNLKNLKTNKVEYQGEIDVEDNRWKLNQLKGFDNDENLPDATEFFKDSHLVDLLKSALMKVPDLAKFVGLIKEETKKKAKKAA